MGRQRIITDQELLAVAREVFREQGHAASTRDVARAAGITQAVLYQRFRSKDELFFAAMLPPPPDMDALLGSEEETQAGVESHLCAIAGRMLAYFADVGPVVLHLATHPSFRPETMRRAHDHLLAARLIEGLAARIGVLVKRGLVSAVDCDAAAAALVAAVHSIAIFRVLAGSEVTAADQEQARRLVRVFWQGLRP